jgi:hypothetical protein
MKVALDILPGGGDGRELPLTGLVQAVHLGVSQSLLRLESRMDTNAVLQLGQASLNLNGQSPLNVSETRDVHQHRAVEAGVPPCQPDCASQHERPYRLSQAWRNWGHGGALLMTWSQPRVSVLNEANNFGPFAIIRAEHSRGAEVVGGWVQADDEITRE